VSIRAKIFFAFVAAVAAGFGLLAYWVTGDLRARYSESFEEVLVDSSRLLAAQLASTWGDATATDFTALRDATGDLARQRFAAPIYSVTKTTTDIRIYVTDAGGRLLFDSRPGTVKGTDFSHWHDVAATLKGNYGARTTDEIQPDASGTPATVSVAYVAAPIMVDGDRVGVVSIGKPKTNIQRFIDAARRKLLLAVLAASAVAIMLAALLYVWVSRPLHALVDYANAVSAGRAAQLPELGDNEVGEVGAAMESMRSALAGKEYVESYVQSLTHEIKSPLTAIRASAELLEGELPPERRARFVQSIEREVDRLSQLADRQLQLATLERADRLTHVETVPLHALLREAAESAAPVAAARGLTLAQLCEGGDEVQGDRLLLRQAFDNLLRNALDFAPAASTVTLAASADTRGVWLSVQDEGPGIPDYARERIFDRFYSLPRPGSGRKSTGLGLNFVREVAHLHGGRVEIDCPGAPPNPGTRARLFVPWRPPGV
jgi:two-component system sensor histidine kinase CreC